MMNIYNVYQNNNMKMIDHFCRCNSGNYPQCISFQGVKMMLVYTIVFLIIVGIGLALITRRVEGKVKSVTPIGTKRHRLVVEYVGHDGRTNRKTIYKGGKYSTTRKYKVGDTIHIRVLRWSR